MANRTFIIFKRKKINRILSENIKIAWLEFGLKSYKVTYRVDLVNIGMIKLVLS